MIFHSATLLHVNSLQFVIMKNRCSDKAMITSIKDFENRKIRVTWTLLLACFNSNKVLVDSTYESRFISEDEIINYAISYLNISSNPKVVSLAFDAREPEEIINILQQLSREENSDYSLEFRKFRAMYVYKNLPSISDDFMHGILRISEIWGKFGFPDDSPNIYFKFKDYSPKNFKKLLEINNNWVISEFTNLKVDLGSSYE